MNDIEMKKCIDCGKEYQATTEYFYKNGNRLQVRCKNCHNIKRKNNLKKEKEISHKSRIVLTEKEEKSFSKKAEEFHISKADFLKLMMLKADGEPLIKINPECFDIFNYQIMGIARNINQIAYLCNSVVFVHQTDIEELRNEVRKIREWQAKLEKEFKSIDSAIKYAGEIISFDDI